MSLQIQPLFGHQGETVEKLDGTKILFDMSDPGTGKTRPFLEAFAKRRKSGGGRALVLAPKSILQPAWGNEIDKFIPGIIYSIAYAKNRLLAFERDADVYITNHDAIKWMKANLPAEWWEKFDTICVDEVTAYKNKDSQRSKALAWAARKFEYREVMSGTPNPNTVLELWHPMLILDGGERLGDSFFRFRWAVSESKQVGPQPQMVKWQDKMGAEEAVFDQIADISIRHRFEDCTDIPRHVERDIMIDLPTKLRAQYEDMVHTATLMLESGEMLQAVNAAVVNNKLLQIASGAVYGEVGDPKVLDDSRSELVADLAEARDHSVIAFLWRHQRDGIIKQLEKRNMTYAVIDGTVTNDQARTEAVRNFQAGDLRCIVCHPQSAGHGLTLTKGTSTIWASPTYNSEHYKQLKHRIYRTGQRRKTETIRILARNTIDTVAIESLGQKLTSMELFLKLMETANG